VNLRLTRPALSAMTAHAAAEDPAEAVGLLVGDPGGPVLAAHPLVNEEERWASTRYSVSAAALAAAQGEIAAAGRCVLGVYHSHPGRPARFSPVDRSGAAPGSVHLIVSVHDSGVEARAWACEAGGRETELAIEVVQ
jgi:proteasome lid subunit RPN8/RPN11